MSEHKIKHIHLDFEGKIPEAINKVVGDLALELCSLENAQVVLTDNIEKEAEVPILYVVGLAEKEIISFEKNYSYFDPNLLESNIGLSLLKRFLGVSSSLTLDKITNGEDFKSYSFKMSDSSSLGHYSDVLATEALNINFNSFEVRNYFFKMVELFEMLKSNSVLYYPLEIDFLVGPNQFIIQACINSSSYSLGTLKDFNDELKTIFNFTDLLNIYSLESGDKFVFCGMWFKEEVSPTLIIEQFKNFKKEEYLKNHKGKNNLLKVMPDVVDEKKSAFGKDNTTKVLGTSKVTLERMAEFVKSKKGDEELDIIRVRGFLEDYPVSQKVKSLRDEEINEIINYIKDNKDSLVATDEEKKNITANDVLDNLIQRIKGMSPEETDEVVRVRGNVEAPNISARIKAWLGEIQQDQVIEGVTDKIQDDVWRVKKSELAEELERRRASFINKSVKESEDELSEIMSLNFEIPKNESNALVRDLLSLSCDDYKSNITESSFDFVESDHSNKLKLENDKLKKEIDNRNKQMRRMRDLVDSMRRKIESGATINSAARISENANEIGQENTLINLKEELKKKDSHIESLKQSLAQLNENNGEKVKVLEEQVSDLGAKLSKFISVDNQNQNQNNDLTLKLKLTEERYEVLNKKYETIKNQDKEYSAQVGELRNEIREKTQEIEVLKQKIGDFEKISPEEVAKETNDLSDKLKASEIENKALELKYKQIEQKNKFLNGKLQDLEKRLQKAQGGSNTNGGTQNNAAAVKQLESKHDRMKQMYDKVSLDLAEKKKELHKYKTESNAMKLRVSDLEKKLSKYEKNAA